jgi:hypothetical protein
MAANRSFDTDTELASLSLTLLPNGESGQWAGAARLRGDNMESRAGSPSRYPSLAVLDQAYG